MTQRTKTVKKTRPAPKPKKAKAGGSKLTRDVNALLTTKRELDRASAKLKPLRDRLAKLEEAVIQRYTQDQLSTVKTKLGSVSRTETAVPQIEDFDKFFDYVVEQKAKELITKKVSGEAWREHLDQGQPVPGVGSFTRVGLQVRVGNKNKGAES